MFNGSSADDEKDSMDQNQENAYRIFDIDVLRKFDELPIQEDDSGVALVVRRAGVPIGFIMADCQPGSALSREAVCQLINDRVPTDLVAGHRCLDISVCPPPTAIPPLTVAICTKDRPDDLENCLRQLLEIRNGHSVSISMSSSSTMPSTRRARYRCGTSDVRYCLELRKV
jgi:hypothetical protein